MSKVTTLADGQITGAVSILIELVEAEETPAVVIITWPAKPTACHPRRFGEIAAAIVRGRAFLGTSSAPTQPPTHRVTPHPP